MIKKYRFFTSLSPPLKKTLLSLFMNFNCIERKFSNFATKKNKASIQKNKKNFAAQAIIVSCRMNLARN